MRYKDFIKECGDKQVFKKLSIYVVSSWVGIQVLSVLYEPLGLSKHFIAYGIILLFIGFPIYILYIWKTSLIYLELEGDELFDTNGNPIDLIKVTKAFRKMFFTSLGVISFMVVFSSSLIIKNTFTGATSYSSISTIDKIAVLKFGNNTGDKNLDIIGKMAADWIIHGITENKVAQVISPELIEDYSTKINTSVKTGYDVILNDYLKPKQIIKGNFYLRGDNLIFQASIIENQEGANETFSFKNIECISENPIDCLENLKQLILGYLISEENELLNLEAIPPKYEAYVKLEEAKLNDDDPNKYLGFLNKSIAIDSTYFEPKILRVAHYYNNDQFHIADSLRKKIVLSSGSNKRQKNLLRMYEAMLKGNNAKVYNYLKNEYKITPFDISTNAGMMVVAMQFVNKPNEVDSIYKAISFQNNAVDQCLECAYRIAVAARAAIEIKNYDKAIVMVKSAIGSSDYFDLKKTLITAYIRSNRITDFLSFMNKSKITLEKEDWLILCMTAGEEFLLQQDKEKSVLYFNAIIEDSEVSNRQRSTAYFRIGEYKKSEELLKILNKQFPTDNEILTKLLIIANKLKSNTENDLLQKVIALRDEFQFGKIDYSLAQYYASKQDNEIAFGFLLKASSSGFRFKDNTFQNDPVFQQLKPSPKFDEILNYWH